MDVASSRKVPRSVDSQGGVIAPFVALMMIVLLGFAAFVIDFGFIYRAKSELQNASDSAALAGALELDNTQAGIDRARVVAKEYALKHFAHSTAVVLRDDDILFGNWNEATQTFTSFGPTPSVPATINALKIIDRREEGTGNPVVHLFAPVLGHPQTDVNSLAIAVSGGPASECGFPMVVADCSLQETIAAGTCDFCMTFQNATTDNAGWTTFNDNLGGPTIKNMIEAACLDESGNVAIDSETGECIGTCSSVPAGMETNVNNGNGFSTGAQSYCEAIQNILLRGGDESTTTPLPFSVFVPVLESGQTSSTCGDFQFSGTSTIGGFATLEIYGAKCGNNDDAVLAASPNLACPAPASGKYVVAALRCDLDSAGPAGGGFFGLDSKHMRLVR